MSVYFMDRTNYTLVPPGLRVMPADFRRLAPRYQPDRKMLKVIYCLKIDNYPLKAFNCTQRSSN
jgi:hypothetical protein